MPASDTTETVLMEVSGAEICAATGSNLGKIFRELSADASQARENRGRYALSFSDYGMRDAPVYAAPAVREFCAALDRGCRHAVYFLHQEPTIGSIRIYLLGLAPVTKNGSVWQYTLQDYVRLTQEHAQRVSAFAQSIGDDAEAAIDGLVLNLPAEALADQPELRQRILRALAPAVRAIAKDFDQLAYDPRGRDMMENLVGRCAALMGMKIGGKVDRKVLEQVLIRLP
jgi:hypothetical protein